jgi:putative phage-type endonuclease
MTPIIYPDRDSWLISRASHIGASEVSTILGVNPYKSAFTLWHERKGLVPSSGDSIASRVGLALEPLLTDFYQESEGIEVWNPGDYTVYQHPDYPWFTCTPDRVLMNPAGQIVRAIELKTIGENVARQLRDGEPPLGYQVQLQAQMAILNCASGDLACLIGNRKFEVFHFARHDRLIEQMLMSVRAFWDLLQGYDPPAVDGSYSTATTLKSLHPDDNGETGAMDESMREHWLAYRRIQEQIKGLDEQATAHKNTVIAAIGANTWTEGEGVRLSYKTQERAACIKISEEYAGVLDKAGIPYKRTEASKYRVLREEKGKDK